MNDHFRGIALSIAHGFECAIALNFLNVNRGGSGGAFQLIGFFELFEGGLSFVGSFLIGFIYTFGTALLPEFAYIVLFLPMIVVLAFRPQGLFGRIVT